MISIYDDADRNTACTIIEATGNYITQVKTVESDGYNAIQLAFDEKKVKHTNNAEMGHFDKAGVKPMRKLAEFRNMKTDKALGQAVNIDEIFTEGDLVHVTGVSKGKGFQGVLKRHGFSGAGEKSHGQSGQERSLGSIGASATPSRVVKGKKMPGRTGGDNVKILNLEVLKLMTDKNLLIVKGAIPGHKGSYVIIEKPSYYEG